MIAEIVINRSAKRLNRTFDYCIPKELEELIMIGSTVLVPFGKSSSLEEGYVVCKTGNKQRNIPLGTMSLNALKEYVEQARDVLIKDEELYRVYYAILHNDKNIELEFKIASDSEPISAENWIGKNNFPIEILFR